jgi:hypothetical protein
VNDFREGFRQVVIGIVAGVILSTLLKSFAEAGLIPPYAVLLFTLLGIVSGVLLMASFTTSGIIFTIGWIIGGLMLKGMLGTFDFAVYLVAPIVILAARGVLYFYSRSVYD